MKIKQSKWLKWKVGAVGFLSLVLLFHEVKSSPAFEQAYASAANQKVQPTNPQVKQDSVMNEWQQSQSSRSSDTQSPIGRRHRQGGAPSSDRNGTSFPNTNDGSTMSPGSNSSSAPNARTGRS